MIAFYVVLFSIRLAAVVVLAISMGLHWAVLQSAAWVGMIVSYSRDASFTEAVSKTFDGQHPCGMCKAIQQAGAEQKQKEEKQTVKPGAKLDLGLMWQVAAFDFSTEGERISTACLAAPARSFAPPKPRPRQLPS